MMNNELFFSRIKEYFGLDYTEYLNQLDKPNTQGFFLNTNKASKEDILSIVDFDYSVSKYTDKSFIHNCNNIGKTKAYELGLIYPQEIAASLPALYVDTKNIKTIVDLCAAPGGKSINILNKLNNDVLLISNEVNHTRAGILSSNFERLGLDNVIVTNKKCDELSIQLENYADLVILDAPCSGEGIIRKYPTILDEYSIDNIKYLANIQSRLLENAYKIIKKGGQLLYSTCTYSFEEDEDQISNFLNRHTDMKIVNLGKSKYSRLEGTLKHSPIDGTEGQFICLMIKDNNYNKTSEVNYLKTTKDNYADNFIRDNLLINDYYLYKYNNHFYLSLFPLIDLNKNILKLGIYIGDVINKRFEPSHNLYRSNLLINKYKYIYALSDEEYEKYVLGYELKANISNNYYLLSYKGHSLGFGKCSNNIIKNKYPKGLRRN